MTQVTDRPAIRVLVTGGRKYTGDVSCLERFNISILIHGGAQGADLRCAEWAHKNGIHTAQVKALWKQFGKLAGPFRNAAMILLEPHYCVAFPGGPGTKRMINLCKANCVRVWQPYG